ncbi:MAG: C25 family cysteine peptidase, partial [Planctomycetota bacterium]
MAFLAALPLFVFGGNAYCEEGEVIVTVAPGPYELKQEDGFHEISLAGYGMDFIPGTPNLPARIHAIAVPPGAEVTGVSLEAAEAFELPGEFRIRPVPLPRAVGKDVEKPELYAKDLALYEETRERIYGSDEAYPSQLGELVRTAGYRKYNLADVRVQPFSYHPKTGKLIYYPKIVINVHYTLPKASLNGPSPEQTYRRDNLVRTEAVARELITNYDQAQAWYFEPAASKGLSLYSFVIITTSSLTSAVQDLVAWESKKDKTVNVVTTTWINANYSGYDTAERIRNFLRDKYPQEEWGIEDVLLVGHYDDVPMRRCNQDLGYGQPETDLYYAELSLPDSESWDKNGDHKWGSNEDPIDFYSEVNVGRIPWSTVS